jgi:hypothetical protein
MKKVIQNKETLLHNLSILETGWKDDFAIKVIDFLKKIDIKSLKIDDKLLIELLNEDFEVASTIFRLFLEKSKDEYTSILKELIPEKGMVGRRGFEQDKKKWRFWLLGGNRHKI